MSYQSVASAEETPTWSHMAAGWGQYKCSCCHGYSQWPSTGSETLVSVEVRRGERAGIYAAKKIVLLCVTAWSCSSYLLTFSHRPPNPISDDSLHFSCQPLNRLSQWWSHHGFVNQFSRSLIHLSVFGAACCGGGINSSRHDRVVKNSLELQHVCTLNGSLIHFKFIRTHSCWVKRHISTAICGISLSKAAKK